MNEGAVRDERLKWTVHTSITKFNTQEAFDKQEPDEILRVPGNLLLNEGVNELWALVAGGYIKGTVVDPVHAAPKAFNAANSFIGVGAGKEGQSGSAAIPTPLAADTGLEAEHDKVYIGMDEGYPIAGVNQKIVFRSTYKPGIACFEWLEWTVANGNGNFTTKSAFNDDCYRIAEKGDEPEPNPIPSCADSPTASGTYDLYPGYGEENVINLNHKAESMGKKYASATWIVTVELSLS